MNLCNEYRIKHHSMVLSVAWQDIAQVGGTVFYSKPLNNIQSLLLYRLELGDSLEYIHYRDSNNTIARR